MFQGRKAVRDEGRGEQRTMEEDPVLGSGPAAAGRSYCCRRTHRR
jgi:hypothetical protein